MKELNALREKIESLMGLASDLDDRASVQDLDAAQRLIEQAAPLIRSAESALAYGKEAE